MSRVIYLDNNATTQVDDRVVEAMVPFLNKFYGNPSSMHSFGGQVGKHLVHAREQAAHILHADPTEIVFTSCGSESDNTAIRGVLDSNPDKRHIITTRVEHPAVLNLCQFLKKRGYEVTFLSVDGEGRLDLDELRGAIRPDTAIVSVMYANNETGVVFPIEEIGQIVKSHGVIFHVDAVQAVGKIDPELWRGADSIAVAAHKIGGPKGIGAVVVGRCTALRPVLVGGGQEYGIRPGTPSAALAAGFGIAADWARGAPVRYAGISKVRDRLEAGAVALGARVNGAGLRLPHVSSVTFEGRRGDEIVAGLDQEGVCVSSGSACSSGASERSPVIEAMLGARRASGSVRASLGDITTEQEVDEAVKAWGRVMGRLEMDEVLLEVLR